MSGHPVRVAVVGAGPAGFYAAHELLAGERAVAVDMFDALPTPFGRVRFGVAPDHVVMKEVADFFDGIAQHPGFRFFGNVVVGRDVAHRDLQRAYDGVLYAVGAQGDRRLGIPGEELRGSWAATDLAAWYNGHPDFQDRPFEFSCSRAVVVGGGNVALDVARMLARSGEELRRTDAADTALARMGASEIREIVVLVRRGPAEANFTSLALEELGQLEDADVVVDGHAGEPERSEAGAPERDAFAARRCEILRQLASRPARGRSRTVRIRFFATPVAVVGNGRVEAIELCQGTRRDGGAGGPRSSGVVESLRCGLVFRAIGCRGVAVPGLPFDRVRATMPNREGRVVNPDGTLVPRVYCAGWIKHGPHGVIGTNRRDSAETVQHMLEDMERGILRPGGANGGAIEEILVRRGLPFVTYAGWRRIDRIERARGQEQGRPRVKLCDRRELVAAGVGPTGRG